MKVIISRASDEFMDDTVKHQYPPVSGAKWSKKNQHWEVKLTGLDHLAQLAEGGQLRVTREPGEVVRVVLDDLHTPAELAFLQG